MTQEQKPFGFYYVQGNDDLYYAPTREEAEALEAFAQMVNGMGRDHGVDIRNVAMDVPNVPKNASPVLKELLRIEPKFAATIKDGTNILLASQKDLLQGTALSEEGVILHEIAHLIHRDSIIKQRLNGVYLYCSALRSLSNMAKFSPLSVVKNIEDAGLSMQAFSDEVKRLNHAVHPAFSELMESEFMRTGTGEALAEKLQQSPEKRDALMAILDKFPDNDKLEKGSEFIKKLSSLNSPIAKKSMFSLFDLTRNPNISEKEKKQRKSHQEKSAALQLAVGSILDDYTISADKVDKLNTHYDRSAEILADHYGLNAKDPRSVIAFFKSTGNTWDEFVSKLPPDEQQQFKTRSEMIPNCHPKDSERITRMEREIKQRETGKSQSQELGLFLKDIGVADDAVATQLPPTLFNLKVPAHPVLKKALRGIAEKIGIKPVELSGDEKGLQILGKYLPKIEPDPKNRFP